MEPDPIQSLCTRCGLCCDGSLLDDVEIAGAAEAGRLESLGLELDEDGDGPVLAQPCAALAGCRCTVYAWRPGSCRAFECALLGRVRRGEVSIAAALGEIARARAGIRRVEALMGPPRAGRERLPFAERCAEALAGDDARDRPRRARLAAAYAGVRRALRATFLDETEHAGRDVISTKRARAAVRPDPRGGGVP